MSTRSTSRRWVRRIAIAAVSLLGFALSAHGGATLLPNGEQQFIDGNGVPLASGTVYMYYPSTTLCKPTYKDAAQTQSNTCPIALDASGRAIIYGAGVYRQQVWACSTPPTNCDNTSGILQWDQATADTSANSAYWAGAAGGTANAITVVDPNFSSIDGSVVAFIPTLSNTGPTSLTLSGIGPFNIVKDTSTGAVSLTGGEIVANSPSNVVQVIYSATQANFHLLNLVNSNASTTPQTLCGAIGYQMANDAGTPSSKLDISADQTTVISNASTISRLNASYVLNMSINGANGLDTGSPAANTFYYVYVIDNGSGGATLASLSSTAPTMPSGYSYKCRLGAVLTNGASALLPLLQIGDRTQYVVNGGSLTKLPQIATSTHGGGTPASPTYAQVSITSVLPPTATQLWLALSVGANGACFAAPNSSYGGDQSINPPPMSLDFGSTVNLSTMTSSFLLESSNISVFGNNTGCSWQALGWVDKVNVH